MAARITPGYHFGPFEQVTPTKLNNMVDLATIDQIPATDIFGSSQCVPPVFGGATPALHAGQLHYDTTPGFEGLKWAFVSASNGSVARWLYRTPHLDGIFWAASGATQGSPQVIASYIRPIAFQIFDGHAFPIIVPLLTNNSAPSLSDCLETVIPLESRAAAGPVVAAMRGIVPGKFIDAITGNGLVYISSYSPTAMKTAAFPAVNRSLLLGNSPAPASGVPGVTLPSWLLLGPVFQDSKI